jgi:hypothetical protein
MLGVELISGDVEVLVSEVGADLAVVQAALDLVPVLVVVDPLLEPVGVVSEAVLLVAAAGDDLSGALVGDGEGEDSEDGEEEDEEEHDEQIEPEEPGDLAARADQPRQGHHHEEDAEHDHGLLEPALALGVGLVAQPYPAGEDRDREHEGQQVQETHEVVADAKHDASPAREIEEENEKREASPFVYTTRRYDDIYMGFGC